MYINLLASTLLGALYLILLFFMCFGVVVGVKIVNLYLRENRTAKSGANQKNDENNENGDRENKPREKTVSVKKQDPQPKTQKIYYLVERKRSRPKAEYSEPKEIKFKK